jgi:hypothetical protein
MSFRLRLRLRLVAGLLMIVITSASAGGVFMRWWTLRGIEMNRPHALAKRFQSQLHLTAEQTQRIEQCLEVLFAEMRDTPAHDLKVVALAKRKFMAAVRGALTPDQRREYDDFQASLNAEPEPTSKP